MDLSFWLVAGALGYYAAGLAKVVKDFDGTVIWDRPGYARAPNPLMTMFCLLTWWLAYGPVVSILYVTWCALLVALVLWLSGFVVEDLTIRAYGVLALLLLMTLPYLFRRRRYRR